MPEPPAPFSPARRRHCAAALLALAASARVMAAPPVPTRPPPAPTDTMLDDRLLDADPPHLDPVPEAPATPAPGRPGDFAFLDGDWQIHHLKRRADGWDRFDGTAHCRSLLDGAGSLEELRIPARGFFGLGLRLLDRPRGIWVDHWIPATSGVLTLPGLEGGFTDGVGLFPSQNDADGAGPSASPPARSIGIWDRIAPGQCRWRQVVSSDGGRTWQHDWVMHWHRLG